MPKLTMTQIEKAFKEAIQREYPKATQINMSVLGYTMPEGTAMYADMKFPIDDDHAGKEKTEKDFTYALVEPDGNCKLLADGGELVCYFQNILDRKRSLLQRFNELNFNDFIGAFIAFAIVGSFTILAIHGAWVSANPNDWVSKEFLAIVGMVLGFYFGRNPRSGD